MKVTDMRNKVAHEARQKSEAMKEKHELMDSRMDNSCTVCIAPFRNKQTIRLTPCGHAFHDDCLLPWLRSGKDHCPSCKLELLHTSKD